MQFYKLNACSNKKILKCPVSIQENTWEHEPDNRLKWVDLCV